MRNRSISPAPKQGEPVNPFIAYRWVGSLLVLGMGITLMIRAF